jgi:membrane-associated phospholipid phosphatase
LPEIFVAAWLWVIAKRDLTAFLRTFFTCYVMGVLVFAIYPVVGPCIAFPESFHPQFHGTLTFRLMEGMASEYTASLQRASVNGFGYFVAIPSLHVALAVVMQAMLRFSPIHFWAFLPINVVVAASTVILGYHYLIDMMAGVALGALVTMPRWRRTRIRHVSGGESATSSLGRERSAQE